MFKKSLLLFFLFFIKSISFSQTADRTIANEQVVVKTVAKAGTYQFVVVNNKLTYIFTDEALVSIEEKRKENEDITIRLNEFVEVFIPSKRTIASGNFKPLSQYFYK